MDGERPEWLPVDWKVCVRVRSSGRKDRYYVSPSNDHRFKSKPEVFRYLKNAEKDLKLRLRNKVDMKKSVKERLLPSGSIKGGKTRRDTVKSEGECIDPSHTDASAQIEKENDSVAEDEEKAASLKKRKKNSKWMNELPRRSSKRLARVEADPPLDVETIGKSELSGSTEMKKHEEASTNLPLEDVSSTEEHECDEKKLKSSLNDLVMDPCIEFAIKTLTGAIPIEDVNKMNEVSPIQASASSCALPFSDIWADPCFEFAVKMLTNEIPVEDGSHFQNAFQQLLSSHQEPLPNDNSNHCITK
ncbi:hypothetical protein SASPL_110726 [Salvia splendens]|uniref:MBD domain-containing protein n=2 Tax=Salvia splendens TaxID=180675 RepID=A0A4D8XY20_SALSN|nr:hypothetical protein SASPL_157622 [Salvia splendens]KAG6426502.1 hypothetical protein SASPL_110726 [Salvia splendens]